MEEAIQLMDAVEAPLDTACKHTSPLPVNQDTQQMLPIDTVEEISGSRSTFGVERVKSFILCRCVVCVCVGLLST